MLRKLAALSLLGLFSAPIWAVDCSVDLQVADQLQFGTDAVSVDKSCKDFTVNLSHTGTMAKNVMGHNWVLTTAADMPGVVADGTAAGLDKDYLKPDDARVIAHTKVIGGGEKDSVTFEVAKLKAGESYMFFCSFPGHAALMKGAVTLK